MRRMNWAFAVRIMSGKPFSHSTVRLLNKHIYPKLLQRALNKQCRPRSDAANRGVGSGSTLFASHLGDIGLIYMLSEWDVQILGQV